VVHTLYLWHSGLKPPRSSVSPLDRDDLDFRRRRVMHEYTWPANACRHMALGPYLHACPLPSSHIWCSSLVLWYAVALAFVNPSWPLCRDRRCSSMPTYSRCTHATAVHWCIRPAPRVGRMYMCQPRALCGPRPIKWKYDVATQSSRESQGVESRRG